MRYVPPLNPDDPLDWKNRPSLELFTTFMEALARVTLAFHELRDDVYPDRAHVVNRLEKWCEKWNLREDYQFGYVFDLLSWWRSHPEDREQLNVSKGLDTNDRRLASDKEPVTITIRPWNPDRESFQSYERRLTKWLAEFLKQQQEEVEAELKRYSFRPFEMRVKGRPAEWTFEWLALYRCARTASGGRWTPEMIATKYRREHKAKVSAAQVRKAILRARPYLGFRDESDDDDE